MQLEVGVVWKGLDVKVQPVGVAFDALSGTVVEEADVFLAVEVDTLHVCVMVAEI